MATLLLLGDITGRSRVAVRMMTQALEARGHDVLALPTALISNTLSMGMHAALDTTDYMLRALDVWRSLGIHYDMLCIGYITGMTQAEALCVVADEARMQGARVLVDPILGDGGRMYRSVTDEQAAGMRLLSAHADLITPNATEACLLAGAPMAQQEADMRAIIAQLSGGVRSVLVTSCQTRAGRDAILGFDAGCDVPVTVLFERVRGAQGGTGDLFSALLADALVRGMDLSTAAQTASDGVADALRCAESPV